MYNDPDYVYFSGIITSTFSSSLDLTHITLCTTICFRMDCYKCITETLDFLLSTSLSHPHSPSVPSSPGPPPAPDPNRLTNREAQIYVSIV